MLHSMTPSSQLLVVVVVCAAVIALELMLFNNAATDTRNDLLDILRRQEDNTATLLEQQANTFDRAIAAVSDATAKAVQSITYPESTADAGTAPINSQLRSVLEMPVLERDRTVDYSDPTDATMPDVNPAIYGPLSADLEGGLGIPGLMVDPNRYDVA